MPNDIQKEIEEEVKKKLARINNKDIRSKIKNTIESKENFTKTLPESPKPQLGASTLPPTTVSPPGSDGASLDGSQSTSRPFGQQPRAGSSKKPTVQAGKPSDQRKQAGGDQSGEDQQSAPDSNQQTPSDQGSTTGQTPNTERQVANNQSKDSQPPEANRDKQANQSGTVPEKPPEQQKQDKSADVPPSKTMPDSRGKVDQRVQQPSPADNKRALNAEQRRAKKQQATGLGDRGLPAGIPQHVGGKKGDKAEKEKSAPNDDNSQKRSYLQNRIKALKEAKARKKAKDLPGGEAGTDAKAMVKKKSEQAMLQGAFKFLWNLWTFIFALGFLHIYTFIKAVVDRKLFGEMNLPQKLQFLGATALLATILFIIAVILFVIMDVIEHPFKNLQNLMQMI